MRTYLDLRYRLLPYLYSVAWQVTSNGNTLHAAAGHGFSERPESTWRSATNICLARRSW